MTDGSPRPSRPTLVTLALAATMALVGGVLVGVTPQAALLAEHADLPHPVVLVALAASLLLAELGLGHVEFRHQAYSFSLTGVPLVLGTLYAPPRDVVLLRVATAVVAFALQRTQPLKFAYNAAAYLLDAALLTWLAHALVGTGSALELRTALLVAGTLVAVDLVMSGLVMVVISVHGGQVTPAAALEVLLPAAAVAVVNGTIGITSALLLGHGALGVLLLAVIAGVTGLLYAGYLRQRRRHQSLEVIQGFIEQAQRDGRLADLAPRLLGRVQAAVRAARVELVLQDDDGRERRYTHTAADDPNEDQHEGQHDVPDDAPSFADLPNRPTIVSARSGVLTDADLLARYGVDEAMVVPLARQTGHGALVALDRLGDRNRFTPDDLALLHALAGHLGVTLQNVRLVDELRWEATHDVLTGLANRAHLLDRLEDAMGRRTAHRRPAVLLLDLNRFKEVNDTLGHHVGDELLQVISQRLVDTVGPGATVARLGGDEFVVLLPEVGSVAEEVVPLAAAIGEALRSPVDLPAATLSTEASIGVAWADTVDSPADVLRHADTAMYASKGAGEPLVVYTPDLDAGRAERLALLADLHVALERDELVLHYQPKLDLRTNRITGVESLLRWEHPRLGWLSPGVFMPIAESTGLIELVIDHVLRLALTQCRHWRDDGVVVTTAVNLSARNLLNPHLPQLVEAALATAGVPAEQLVLEITESSVMGDPSRTMPILEHLASLGITLSLDDFGTGYSSLSYLQRLPVKEVKIDRSFVIGLFHPDPGTARTSRILVEAIIGLGSSLGLRVVAEGVEDEDTLQLLRDLGCDVVQGYLTGRPAAAADLRLAAPRIPAPRGGPGSRVRQD